MYRQKEAIKNIKAYVDATTPRKKSSLVRWWKTKTWDLHRLWIYFPVGTGMYPLVDPAAKFSPTKPHWQQQALIRVKFVEKPDVPSLGMT